MKRKVLILFLILLIFPASSYAAGKGEEAALNPLEKLEKALAVDTYMYEPKGKRDPFRSVLLARISKREERRKELVAKVPFTPLQQFDISSLKLTAIFWGGMGSYALIEAPDGKGYTVKRGTFIGKNRGVVGEVGKGMIVIDEEYVDIDDIIKSRRITLKLVSEE